MQVNLDNPPAGITQRIYGKLGEYQSHTYCAVCGRLLTQSAELANGYLYCNICAP